MKNLFIILLLCSGLATYATQPVPSDPKATPEAVKLYQKMMELQHKGLMFGHQDDMAYGTSWYSQEGRSDVKDVCGDYPAIILRLSKRVTALTASSMGKTGLEIKSSPPLKTLLARCSKSLWLVT